MPKSGKVREMDDLLFPLLNIARLRMGIDGIGVTTLVAGAGCPLSCRYCINKRLLKEAPVEHVMADELLRRVRIDDLYFRTTGGGITFGGGEALLHAAFIRRFRSLCPPEWRITVETSLAVPRENVLLCCDTVDEFIVDCKDMDPEIYRCYTGGDVNIMRENLTLLLASCEADRILIRVPKISDFNNSVNQSESVRVLQEMGATRLDLFDYVIR